MNAVVCIIIVSEPLIYWKGSYMTYFALLLIKSNFLEFRKLLNRMHVYVFKL